MKASISLPLLMDLFLRRRRFLLISWIATAVVPAFYLALFPSLASMLTAFSDLPEAITSVLGDVDIATAEGYFVSEVLALTGPLLIGALAISLGSTLITSEADLTLAPVFFTPLSRRQVALTHLVLVIVGVVGACGLILAGTTAAKTGFGIELATKSILVGIIPLAAFGLFAGALAFSVASTTGSATVGTTVAWGSILLALLVNSAGQIVAGASWLTSISPWGWYGAGASVSEGLDASGMALLLGGAVALFTVGVEAFHRRDLGL